MKTMTFSIRAIRFAAAGILTLACLAPADVVPGSKKVDPVRQAAWNAAQQQAAGKIDRFDAAVKSGNPDAIRQTTLDLQADPIAVQKLNNGGRRDLIDRHIAETQSVRNAAKDNIKRDMADKWNADHPHDPITPDDVEIFEPTNYKKPGAEPRTPQDWDVTVRVRGKDVPLSQSKGVVEGSFYKAAGGEKTFGPGSTPESVAHQQAVEVTDSGSLESYKEPDKILGGKDAPPDPGSKLNDAQDLGEVIEYKSNLARNKADAARASGNQVEGVRQDFEQMRQAVKQYDKITDPRVKAQGGKVGNQVEAGMKIMRDVADMKISPEQGRAQLAEMGETPESITRKAASQVEAAQKLKPPDAPKAPDAPKTTAPDAPKTTAPDAPKTTAPDAPKVAAPDTPKVAAPDAPKVAAPDAPKVAAPDAPKTVAPDAPKVAAPDAPKTTAPDAPKVATPDAPKTTAPDAPKVAAPDAPKVATPDAPKVTPDAPKVAAPDAPKTVVPDAPKVAAPDAPKVAAPDAPKVTTPDAPKTTAPDAPKVVAPDAPKVTTPDAPKVTTPDAPKTTAPDAPKVAAPDAPKVTAPDAPKANAPDVPSGKVGKALKGLNTAGDAIDLFGNAQDFTEAAQKGDTEGMKQAVVNTADSFTGGGYATGKMVEGRAQEGGKYAAEVEGLDRNMEAVRQNQIELDLRKAGYSQSQAEAMVANMAKGDDGAVKDAYQKMGKDMPAPSSAGIESVGEAVSVYGAEVKENLGELGTGLKTQAGKAGTFLKNTASNLGEMGVGVTESGVASELAGQVGQNLRPSNLKEGYDAWQQSKQADAQVSEGRQSLEDSLIAKGAKPSEAKQAADDFYGIGTEDGRSDRSTARTLSQKLKDKQAKKDAEAKKLKDAEANGEGGEGESDDDEEGGGLKGFKEGRTAKADGKAESSYGLMGQEQNLAEASTRGDQAEADAKNVVAAAGADAQATSGKAAASSAAADRDEGWGKAIADGVQQGVEAGATALGSSFGDTAGKHASDAAFGDPDKKKHGGKGGGKGEEGDGGEQVAGGGPGGATGGPAVKSGGGGKGGGSSAKKGKGDGKKTASGKKPPTKSSSSGPTIKCPKCGGTKFGPYEQVYETKTVIGRDRRCLTCGHLGGVIVSGSSAPSAPKPAPAAPAPPPVKMKRVATHASCGSEMKFEGVYYADGTDMYSCPKCGGTYHNVGGAPAIIFKEVPDTSAP